MIANLLIHAHLMAITDREGTDMTADSKIDEQVGSCREGIEIQVGDGV